MTMTREQPGDHPEGWRRRGEDAGYDKHVDMLVEIWHETADERVEQRSLHDFLHMTWEQYQYYESPGPPKGE